MRRFRVDNICSLACLLFFICGFTGCGSRGRPDIPTGTVMGEVMFKDQPVQEGLVNFEAPGTGSAAQAVIADGKFEVPVPLLVGEYKVTVMPPDPAPPQPGKKYVTANPKDIPKKFRNPKTSDLFADVAEGQNTFTFDLSQ